MLHNVQQQSSNFFHHLIVHLGLCRNISHEDWWSIVLLRSGDTVQVHCPRTMEAGVPACPVCVAKLSMRRALWRTGRTVGRAGVRWCAGLLLVLRCAVRLQRRRGCWRILAFRRTTFAAEQLAFDFPEVVTVIKSELLSSLYVFTGKKGNVWETKVLVCCEHSTGKQVGLAHVIEKATDVSIETGINAVQVLWLII